MNFKTSQLWKTIKIAQGKDNLKSNSKSQLRKTIERIKGKK